MLQLTSLGYVVMGWIAVLFMLANIFLLELQAQTVSEAETMFRTDVMLSPPDWLTAIIRWLVNGEEKWCARADLGHSFEQSWN